LSVVRLTDIVQDLSKSFDLPPAVVPSKAVLGLVRISIPTIDSSAIIVELESVKLRIRFLSDAELANSLNKDARKGTKHDSHVAMSDAGFQSVVDSAPKEEKATLEAALPSVEGAFGTFIGSLQALFSDGTSSLIASIKNGALDRLQVKIKDASIRVDMDVPDVDGNSGDTPTIQTSAMLTINDFFLQDACSPLSNQDRAGGSIEKKRQVTFSHVQAFLVSDLDVFERHSRFTPTAPEQLGDSRYGPSSHGSPTSPRIPADIDLMMSQSTIFGQGDDEQHRGQDGNYIDEAMQSIRSTKRSDRVLQEISGNVSLNSTQVREDQMLKEDSGHSSQILSPAKPGSIGNGVSAQSMRDDPTDLRKTAGHTDMQASRISTHFPEGEKSMYMSTLSRAGEIEANRMEASSASNAMPRMPGAFGESVYHPPAHSDARTFGETPTKRYSYDAFDNTTKAAKRILNIDKISLSLATPTQQKDEGTTEDRSPSAQQVNEDDDHGSTMKDSTMSEAVMGFSVANPPMSVPRDQPNSMHGVRAHQAREKSATGSTQEGYSLDIGVPSIDVCFDTSCGWLAYKMIHQALTGLGGEEEVAPPSADNDATPITVNAKLSTFAFRFVESQPTSTLRPDELHPDQQHEIDPLATILHLTLKELQVHQEAFANEKALRLKVRKVTLGHGREDIISFNQGLRMRESIRDMSLTSQDDLSIDLSKTTEGTRVNVNTLPMQLMLNLSLLDETLGWFGGLSSILELGSSIASMSTAKEPYKAPAPRKSLGVRFTDDLPPKKAEPVGIANAVEVQPSCKQAV
ncbi:autophagy- protein 2, partial [Ascosphaera atra]